MTVPFTAPFNTPLLEPDLRAAGVPAPWTFGVADKTRFGELDVLGHVNNTAYLRWAENFRINYFKDYGIADYTGEPPRLVLRQIGLDFLKEMTLHEPYIITGRTVSLRNTSFRMEYAIWSGDLRATGHAVLVWLTDQGQKTAIPDHARQVMITRDGAEQL